ncbi:MAG: glycosyltransferase family A protein [Bacteriovoracaceae bacterium]
MKISVIIPVFNRKNLLIEVLTSLTKQTLEKKFYEVIVIDDASTEELKTSVENICIKSELNFQYFKMERNGGPAKARNFGIAKAKFPIIALTDSDCKTDPNWLLKSLHHFENKKVGAVEGKTVVPDQTAITPFTHQTQNLTGGRYPTCNFFFRKGIAIFNENYTLAFREDSDFAFTILNHKYEIVFDPELIVYHPCLKASLLTPFKLVKRYEYDGLLKKRFPNYYAYCLDRVKIGPLTIAHLRKKIYLICVFFTLFSIIGISISFSNLPLLLPLFAMGFSLNILMNLKAISFNLKKIFYLPAIFVLSLIIPFLYLYYYIKGLVRFRKVTQFEVI